MSSTGDSINSIEIFPSASDLGQVRRWPSITACNVACICAVASGFVLGYSSPTESILNNIGLLPTVEDKSWFTAFMSLGALLGAPLGGLSVDYFGRKTTILLISLPSVSGWLLIAYASGNVMIFIGRILTGMSLGCTTATVPLYIGEIAPPSLRGLLGASFQLWTVVGILITFSLGIPLNYIWLAITAVAVVTVYVVAMVFMPETPRWLLKQDRKREAFLACAWLLGSSKIANEELGLIQENLEKQEPMSFRELGKRSILRPLVVAVCLVFFQQFSGINAVMMNAQDIFTQAGFKDSNVASVIVAAVQVVATAVSAVLVDRLGRRILLLSSGTLMCLSSVSYGVYDYLYTKTNHSTSLTPLALVSLIVYIIGFSIGWGPIPWIVMSEIFPVRAKGIGSGIATFVCWTSSFIITLEFLDLEKAITVHGTFWVFAGICFASVVFVAVFLPETKGRSLEEIESLFAGPKLESQIRDGDIPKDSTVIQNDK